MRVALFLFAALLACASATKQSCPTPTITVPSDSTHAGDSLVATATGLVPQSTYFFVFGRPTLTPLIRLSGTSDADGNANVEFTLPADKTQPANYTASIACRCNGKTISASTVVVVVKAADDAEVAACPTPVVLLDAKVARPNQVVMAAISTGINAAVPITIRIARPRLAPLITLQGTSDAFGNAKVGLHIPNDAPSDNFMVGVTVDCGNDQFAIGSAPLAISNSANQPHPYPHAYEQAASTCAAPTLILSSTIVPPGGVIELDVSGAPASVVLTVRVMLQGLPRSPLLTATGNTTASGEASIKLPFPASASAGGYNVFVMTPCSGGQPVISSTPVTVSTSFPTIGFACATPQLILSSSSVAAGTSFKIHVSALPANADVTVRVVKRGLSPLLTLPFTADATGTLDAMINVPAAAPAGAYGVGATAQCDGSPVMAAGSITIASA